MDWIMNYIIWFIAAAIFFVLFLIVCFILWCMRYDPPDHTPDQETQAMRDFDSRTMEMFRNIETVFWVSPSPDNQDNGYREMNYMESYDTDDLDQDGNPKDLSFSQGIDTSDEFPNLRLDPEHVPVGDAPKFCVNFAWRNKDVSKSTVYRSDGSY